MSAVQSALYAGAVAHRRLRPKRHRLRYRVFSLLLDIDETQQLARRLRFFSVGRFNLFSFHPRDHLSGADDDLRAQIEAMLRGAGVEPDGGPIRLLTMPRILGYAFNPLSIFFSYRADGSLAAILYEVNNTFGQRHFYLVSTTSAAARAFEHRCRKEFYVSPFLAMEMAYAFRIRPPGETFALSISVTDRDGPLLNATQNLSRFELSDTSLLRWFFACPLLTLKVILGIHYEALLLWLKGVGLHVRPSPPRHTITIIPQDHS